MDIKSQIIDLHNRFVTIEKNLLDLRDFIVAAPGYASPKADRGEMIANATLAYRHAQDAAMRLHRVAVAHDAPYVYQP